MWVGWLFAMFVFFGSWYSLVAVMFLTPILSCFLFPVLLEPSPHVIVSFSGYVMALFVESFCALHVICGVVG